MAEVKVISGIQTALIDLLKQARTDSANQNYPLKIKGYNGELENVKRIVRSMPMVTVNLSNEFEITADDNQGELHTGVYKADLILFEKNNLNQEETLSEMATLIDWVIDALRGQTITVGGIPIPVAEQINGQYFPALNAAVLTLNLGVLE